MSRRKKVSPNQLTLVVQGTQLPSSRAEPPRQAYALEEVPDATLAHFITREEKRSVDTACGKAMWKATRRVWHEGQLDALARVFPRLRACESCQGAMLERRDAS